MHGRVRDGDARPPLAGRQRDVRKRRADRGAGLRVTARALLQFSAIPCNTGAGDGPLLQGTATRLAEGGRAARYPEQPAGAPMDIAPALVGLLVRFDWAIGAWRAIDRVDPVGVIGEAVLAIAGFPLHGGKTLANALKWQFKGVANVRSSCLSDKMWLPNARFAATVSLGRRVVLSCRCQQSAPAKHDGADTSGSDLPRRS
jgi:hypothetical protein